MDKDILSQLRRIEGVAAKVIQRQRELRAICQELGFSHDNAEAAPEDLLNAIRMIKARNAALEKSHNELRGSMAAIHNTIREKGVATSLSAMLTVSKNAWEKAGEVNRMLLTKVPVPTKVYGPYLPKLVGAGVYVAITDELPPELEGKPVWLSVSRKNTVNSFDESGKGNDF